MSEIELIIESDTDLVIEDDVIELVIEGGRGSTGQGLPAGGTDQQLVRKVGIVDFVYELFTFTKDFIGLGNVTDDAQLKRSAGDFQAFSQKITPAAGDSVLIEDGSDGNNKKRALIDSFLNGDDIEWTDIDQIVISSTPSADFIDVFDDTYDIYRIVFSNCRVDTSNRVYTVVFGYGAGPTWVNTGYSRHLALPNSSSGSYASGFGTNQAAAWLNQTLGNTVQDVLNGNIIIYNLREAALFPQVLVDLTSIKNQVVYNSRGTFLLIDSTNKMEHIRILPNAGNLEAGTITIQGGNLP